MVVLIGQTVIWWHKMPSGPSHTRPSQPDWSPPMQRSGCPGKSSWCCAPELLLRNWTGICFPETWPSSGTPWLWFCPGWPSEPIPHSTVPAGPGCAISRIWWLLFGCLEGEGIGLILPCIRCLEFFFGLWVFFYRNLNVEFFLQKAAAAAIKIIPFCILIANWSLFRFLSLLI